MINKKPLKSFSTGTLIALGLSINSLYSVAANTTEVTDLKNNHKHNHHPETKLMEGGCGSNMRMDMQGMVMNENKDDIPKDCKEITEDVTIVVKAGTKYSEPYPGTVFGFNEHQWQVKPCSRITVEFSNEDDIRHQWMIHGLPTYLYPKGMFHIEVNGQNKKTGTFIVPNSHYTYLVHCDIAQHMEKGMKAQLKVGNGRGDLPSIPGISNPTFPDIFTSTP
ncbi:MAG: cupredoxin domain-containing protein [Methylococcales bacterium]|nr:cupredoxin domain-containing protein [Methylococcales bacterium]